MALLNPEDEKLLKRIKGQARARGKHVPGEMNKLERSYAERLEILKHAGNVSEYFFESVKFRLADKTWYTPDFMVILIDGATEFHETKGFFEEDARVKIKVAAEMFPFTFKAAKFVKGAWVFEEF